ncbi:MAG: HlyC/CorC family transporter [bacterium]|nr:HlyC/CorC family transporter [bacterium]
MVTEIIILAGLLASTFFISAVTVFFISLTSMRLKKILEKKGKRYEETLGKIWERHAERITGTAIIVKALLELSLFLCLFLIVADAVQKDTFIQLGITAAGVVLAQFFVVVLPELLLRRSPELISPLVIFPMYCVSLLFIPLVKCAEWIISLISIIFKIKVVQLDSSVTEEEIRTMVEIGEVAGTVEESERKMIHSIFDFGDTIVREVMSPRVEMECISQTASLLDAIALINAHHHSRIPVYKDNIDNIVGILYAKDVLNYVNTDRFSKVTIKDVMHPPMFVPETKLVSELLHEFRKLKTHLAIAVDEYGGTSGLVTIEDILEEIIGEIQDEYDTDEEVLYTAEKNGDYLVDARLSVAELLELLDIDDRALEGDGEYDTVGGYVFSKLGNIPDVGEIITSDSLKIEVLEADKKSVKKLRIHVLTQSDHE